MDELSLQAQNKDWFDTRKFTPRKLELAKLALEDIRGGMAVFDAIKRHPLEKEDGGGYISKYMLVTAYRFLVNTGELEEDPELLSQIRMKPMRTMSGVTVVTVLTKPYPCPGNCIFCPTDERMPKSYLPDEPGAMRALHHEFDPYTQVAARLQALESVGHPTDKIELLILGGTWSYYEKEYQEWFIKRCFDAMNEKELDSLEKAQKYNETASHRNVGLVIETRPDHVTVEELSWLRYLGVTKVQMGAQSFDEWILKMNRRGHTAADTRRAVALLRAGGFKIVLHWMPNLYGATPESDRKDYAAVWQDVCPDEIKIYPNQLLENTALYKLWEQEKYKPYDTVTLTNLLLDIKPTTPRYCRINRIVRDIPSTHVVEGNKRTSLRMDLKKGLTKRGERCQCIRCREVKKVKVDVEKLKLDDLIYPVNDTEEHFLSYMIPEDKLAGFLRLSLPGENSPDTEIPELKGAAIIREVHIYGQSLEVGQDQHGAAQHIGLGTQLLEKASEIAREKGFASLAVIAAIGTREYYRQRGFTEGNLYLVKRFSKV
ncbi:MAG: tRNA uridine(34) 5-carboxymethylaminomethyl modification radical SAM/GNAT enzyme Elp3 [Anaerolineales bacterium]|nr:tRNA uridine(34) 5-carboxymethylaminomethyl modification radical SAM/GNAT enzyme Elp3 [Anaerolineales bacterium]